MEDFWRHRSVYMTRHSCMWYLAKEPNQVTVEGQPPPMRLNIGRCRRHAPSANFGWPVVTEHDWCGDHKLDEEKV